MPYRLPSNPNDSLEKKASRAIKIVTAVGAIGLALLLPGKTQDSSFIKDSQYIQLDSNQIEEKNLNYVLEEMKREHPDIYYLVDPEFELKKQEYFPYAPHIPYGEEFPFYKDYEIPENKN